MFASEHRLSENAKSVIEKKIAQVQKSLLENQSFN